MSNCQAPWLPPFAKDLDSRIVQVHSKGYRNPSPTAGWTHAHRWGGQLRRRYRHGGRQESSDVDGGKGIRPHPVPHRVFRGPQSSRKHRAVRRTSRTDGENADRSKGQAQAPGRCRTTRASQTDRLGGRRCRARAEGRRSTGRVPSVGGRPRPSRWKTSSGAQGSARASHGSISPSSATVRNRHTSKASLRESLDCISSGLDFLYSATSKRSRVSKEMPNASRSRWPLESPSRAQRQTCWIKCNRRNANGPAEGAGLEPRKSFRTVVFKS